jgi:hypothetical protein
LSNPFYNIDEVIFLDILTGLKMMILLQEKMIIHEGVNIIERLDQTMVE